MSKSSDVRIADHGSGNAYVLVWDCWRDYLIVFLRAWLLSTASDLKKEQYKRISFAGFNILGVHYPASQNLTKNVKLGVLDAFNENISEEHIGQYDIVHVRVFTAVVKNNDPGPLIRNAFKKLKPGGYLQWDEFDGGSFKAVAPGSNPEDSSVLTAATQEMVDTSLQSSQRAMNLNYSWVGMLGSLFQQCGLEVIEDKRMDVKNELQKAMTDSLLMMLSKLL